MRARERDRRPEAVGADWSGWCGCGRGCIDDGGRAGWTKLSMMRCSMWRRRQVWLEREGSSCVPRRYGKVAQHETTTRQAPRRGWQDRTRPSRSKKTKNNLKFLSRVLFLGPVTLLAPVQRHPSLSWRPLVLLIGSALSLLPLNYCTVGRPDD
ncbi:uncharacterized protein J3D65DRAFT_415162 [Phyllosticta citribraziliensis]|uniref:Uncharacterized protein n=1 Tax=Phyllosticta citribraziliensis TaxID=989973 RepID=A0ABR1LNR2_9PEZI